MKISRVWTAYQYMNRIPEENRSEQFNLAYNEIVRRLDIYFAEDQALKSAIGNIITSLKKS